VRASRLTRLSRLTSEFSEPYDNPMQLRVAVQRSMTGRGKNGKNSSAAARGADERGRAGPAGAAESHGYIIAGRPRAEEEIAVGLESAASSDTGSSSALSQDEAPPR
jgi:hypothetical protein